VRLLSGIVGAALAAVGVLTGTGIATPNEGLMAATFFASITLWLAYLGLLIEAVVRLNPRTPARQPVAERALRHRPA
jgi:hypothetical protein